MSKDEFIRLVVGKPWVDRACSFEAMDCWGVVVLYFRYVYGVEIPHVIGYETGETSIESGFAEQVTDKKWIKVEKPSGDGVAFMAFKNGVASHVGVVVDGLYILHSAGTERCSGQVRYDKLNVFNRTNPSIEFYRYMGLKC